MKHTFRRRSFSKDVEASTSINRPKKDSQDGRSKRYQKDPPGLVLLLGSHEHGKVALLDSLQKYHDAEQRSKRYRLYKTKIVARTCQRFQAVLMALQSDIDLLNFEEIKTEVQSVLEHDLFSESTAIPTSLLAAIRVLCRHYVLKQRLHDLQFLKSQSSIH